VHPAWKPFCSERCKLQDLAKWVDGEYRIAAEPVTEEITAIDNDTGDDDTPGDGHHS